MIDQLKHDDKAGCFIFHNIKIFYLNYGAALQTLDEVFFSDEYTLHTDKLNPFILDCGADIGIATMSYKMRYPDARIIYFEPDPMAFRVLEHNISVNKLQNVTTINAALTTKAGVVDFYGQVSTDHPDTRGNSILPIWGNQRTTSSAISVPGVQLSNYINEPIDFLKVDIEGAEQQILEEVGDKLRYVKELFVEVHECNGLEGLNNVNAIVDLLRHNDCFNVSIKTSELTDTVWPMAVKRWVNDVKPKLYYLYAKNNEI